MTESAVDQVVGMHFAKNRQMRWSDQGTHLLAQLRMRALNADLRLRAVPIPLRATRPIADPKLDAGLLQLAA